MKSPIVDEVISRVMARHKGTTPAALAAYFEDVHQELAPLARRLEHALREGGAPQALFDNIRRDFLP